MKLKSAWLFGTILCTLPLLFPVPSHAQAPSPSAVFTIGEFNRSSVDLAAGTPQQPVKFIVGTSTASKDWYANQRVEQAATPAAPAVSPRPAATPWTIQFSLANAPAPSYRFHVALLIESSSVPALRVVINGKIRHFLSAAQTRHRKWRSGQLVLCRVFACGCRIRFSRNVSASRRKHHHAASGRESSSVAAECGVAG